jgi:transposase
VTIVERLVPDVLWDAFRRVAPAAPVRPQGGGRQRYGDREVLAAIVFVAASGCAWRDLPPAFGPSGPTVHRRFGEWSRAGVWERLRPLCAEGAGARAGDAAELRWARWAVDAVAARVPARG